MYLSMKDLDLKNKFVGVRVDLNSPVVNGKIILNERFYAHLEVIKELLKNNCKVVLFSHQGRKGKKSFLPSLEQHANLLSKLLGNKVYYYDGLIEEDAISFVKNLRNGEIVLMKNLRFYDFETNKEKIYNNPFIRSYSEILDFYILDAFSIAHREHSSVVGFKDKIPNLAGPLFEKELSNVIKLKHHSERPFYYVLGGEKVDDLIDLIIYSIENRKVNKIITGGLLAVLALEAAGIETNDERVKKNEKIIDLLSDYINFLEIPEDVAINLNERRKDINVFHLKNLDNVQILDIGKNTANKYYNLLKKAKTIYAKGPMG
ncbi:MAG: phosphoglycerate kinase, partial [Nanoarchaeota archaeon]